MTALSDGILRAPIDSLIGEEARGAACGLADSSGAISLAVATFLVDLGGQLALVDAGSGASLGPELGKHLANLAAVGVTPDKIDYVFLTHMHPDHSNGLVDQSGEAVYANAQIVLHEQEARFWLDDDLPAGSLDIVRQFQRDNRRTAAAYRDRIRRAPDGEVRPGVSAWLHPGHTPGHTAWLFESGSEGLLIWGDVVHIARLQIRDPDIGLIFDLDCNAARSSRRRALDRAAADGLWVAGAHLDWPHFGRVNRSQGRYQYEPLAPADARSTKSISGVTAAAL